MDELEEPEDEFAARIRAARGYARLSQKALGARLGLGENAMKARENPRKDPATPGERMAVARICHVPLAFLEHGFPPDLPENYGDQITSQLAELREQVAAIRVSLAAVAARTAPPPPPEEGSEGGHAHEG